jgi:hypothetical protein
VDDIVCSSTPTNEHALGVDDDSAFPFPVPFSVWVSSAERYWVTLTKHRSLERGKTRNYRYRLIAYGGTLDPAAMSRAWKEFVKEF